MKETFFTCRALAIGILTILSFSACTPAAPSSSNFLYSAPAEQSGSAATPDDTLSINSGSPNNLGLED